MGRHDESSSKVTTRQVSLDVEQACGLQRVTEGVTKSLGRTMTRGSRIDVETTTNKKHDLNKSKDETRHDPSLYKLVPKVFRLKWKPKSTGKQEGDEDDAKSKRTSSSSPPRVIDQTSGVAVSLDSQTIVTPYPAMEVAPDDTLSAPGHH
ncbi:hypothetical protein HAX54_024969 [Datura stramonium]|uniref:Uncharacterized protein n=1 Tax=Datura stramonium TaxID=4076 RepID=A0ABS8S6T8_DATST|nr:hypothetical protein [Datura stramonium]